MAYDFADLFAQRERDRYAIHSRHLNEQMVRALKNRTPTAYAAVLASLMVSSAYVPLNPQFPRDRCAMFCCLRRSMR
jgi:non-ribosomal peptide synthetase component F